MEPDVALEKLIGNFVGTHKLMLLIIAVAFRRSGEKTRDYELELEPIFSDGSDVQMIRAEISVKARDRKALLVGVRLRTFDR